MGRPVISTDTSILPGWGITMPKTPPTAERTRMPCPGNSTMTTILGALKPRTSPLPRTTTTARRHFRITLEYRLE